MRVVHADLLTRARITREGRHSTSGQHAGSKDGRRRINEDLGTRSLEGDGRTGEGEPVPCERVEFSMGWQWAMEQVVQSGMTNIVRASSGDQEAKVPCWDGLIRRRKHRGG